MRTTVILYHPGQYTRKDKTLIEGKFLQLLWRNREYLLFSPLELHRYHNEILGQFLEENGIDHRWTDEITLEVDDHKLNTIGGGRFRLDQDEQTLHLWNNSQAYGRFDAFGLTAKIGAAGAPWKNYKVSIS